MRSALFNGPMIVRLLAGDKTQTRRTLKPQPAAATHRVEWNTAYEAFIPWGISQMAGHSEGGSHTGKPFHCPYGAPGDQLVVKEASWIWCERRRDGETPTGRPKYRYVPIGQHVVYCADGVKPTVPIDDKPNRLWRWKAGRFMPRWASRITLAVTNVRVERVQEISEEDAAAEGCSSPSGVPATNREWFQDIWTEINGAESWTANPWVWALTVRRVEQAELKEVA